MTDPVLRYDRMVEEALRGVLREALVICREGLPGNHHFYITFRTGHPGVEIADYIRSRYPEEMTIVLQHQFWGLEVTPDWFEVTLSFNRVNERLHVPFAAVTAFADPSAKFGLQFQVDGLATTHPARRHTDMSADTEISDDEAEDPNKQPAEGAEVITLDAFRKK